MAGRLLSVFLMLLVLVPPGAGLSVAQDMPPAMAVLHDRPASHPEHAADASIQATHHAHAMMTAHDHGAAECDDYCMNCSSHCYTTAIVSSGNSFPVSASPSARLESGDTTDRAYLLFRPPIRA